MLQDDSLKQFEYLLLEIIKFANMNIPYKDACNLSFYTTSKNFCISNPTIRDLVTRRCNNSKIADFHQAILNLYNHDDSFFKTKYYSSIDRSYHKKFDAICEKFNSICYNENNVDPILVNNLKKFIRFSEDEKRNFINILQSKIIKK